MEELNNSLDTKSNQSDKNERKKNSQLFWSNFAWSSLSLFYLLSFLLPLIFSKINEPDKIKMSFLILGFAAFSVGFIQYFYGIISFSPTQQIWEIKKSYKSPPKMLFVSIKIILGFACVLMLYLFNYQLQH